jgi:hypothetical protein
MPMNRVQFQPGRSMAEFMDRDGTEEQCEAALIATRCAPETAYDCLRLSMNHRPAGPGGASLLSAPIVLAIEVHWNIALSSLANTSGCSSGSQCPACCTMRPVTFSATADTDWRVMSPRQAAPAMASTGI